MRFSQIILLGSAALFLGMGLSFLLNPNLLGGFLEVNLYESTTAQSEVRATYGGMFIGLATFFLISSFGRHLKLFGLLGLLCLTLGIAFGRLYGILNDSPVSFTTYGLFAFEVVWFLLTLNAWYFQKRFGH